MSFSLWALQSLRQPTVPGRCYRLNYDPCQIQPLAPRNVTLLEDGSPEAVIKLKCGQSSGLRSDVTAVLPPILSCFILLF